MCLCVHLLVVARRLYQLAHCWMCAVHPEVTKVSSLNNGPSDNGIVISACEEDRPFAREIQGVSVCVRS